MRRRTIHLDISRVQLGGSRVVKQKDNLRESTALAIKYGHQLAEIGLAPLGIKVVQYKIGHATRPKIRGQGKNHLFLLSGRVRLNEASQAYFDHARGNPQKNFCPCEQCGLHRKIADEANGRIKPVLFKLGLRELDMGAHNLAFTHESPVLFETMQDDMANIDLKAENRYHEHFGAETAAKLRKILAEYRRKLAKTRSE